LPPTNETSSITDSTTWLCKFNSGHHGTGRMPHASETSTIMEPATCLCKFNFGQYEDRSFASCRQNFGYNGGSYLPLQVQLRSSRTGRLPHANRTSSITEPATCLWMFNSGHHGTGRLPHANGAFGQTRAFRVSALCSTLRCYACIYMKVCMKVCFCMKARVKGLSKIMQRTSIDQILNLCGETIRWLKSNNTEVHLEILTITRWISVDIETNWCGLDTPKLIIESLSSGWKRITPRP
jgi:hypothetical protein